MGSPVAEKLKNLHEGLNSPVSSNATVDKSKLFDVPGLNSSFLRSEDKPMIQVVSDFAKKPIKKKPKLLNNNVIQSIKINGR